MEFKFYKEFSTDERFEPGVTKVTKKEDAWAVAFAEMLARPANFSKENLQLIKDGYAICECSERSYHFKQILYGEQFKSWLSCVGWEIFEWRGQSRDWPKREDYIILYQWFDVKAGAWGLRKIGVQFWGEIEVPDSQYTGHGMHPRSVKM